MIPGSDQRWTQLQCLQRDTAQNPEDSGKCLAKGEPHGDEQTEDKAMTQ